MTLGGRPLKFISKLEAALVVMALISVAIILIPAASLRTSLTIVPTEYPAALVNDAFTGGNSEVRWLDREAQRWQCEIGQASPEPYCSLQLDVTDANGQGLDLRRFDTMTVWADYQGNATHMRIYLRNRHPNYYKPGISISTKFNAVEVLVKDLAAGLVVDMNNDFSVPDWWLVGGDIPLAFSRPEFNDISLIEFQTGSTVRSGVHEIQVQKIVWKGHLIERTVLYQSVIIAWALAILGMLAYRVLNMRSDLNRQRQYQQELLAINRSLNVKSRRYKNMAKTDALTGLPNRVGIRNMLHKGLTDWRDNGAPFSFAIIDLDNFKHINDTYGHDVGDRILKDVARLMSNRVRRTDAVARWGGEEFVLVCPDTTLEQALQVAENLRAELDQSLSHDGLNITASFGVASMTEPNLDSLFKKADNALYKAKELGRNRVCSQLEP
ncbi:GGDEF domain-containing protein [Marinimicrobium locisalis]|uniref:GGDEF domain-containing protein n=1 Tax=Marinimicrobium locisalis TaxID=546022 RepID=UPI003221AFEB